MAEIYVINWFQECMSIMIRFQKVSEHRKEIKNFEQDLLSYLIQLYYREINKVRRKRCKGEVSTELEQKGFYLIKKDGVKYDKAIIESIRTFDVIEKENDYIVS